MTDASSAAEVVKKLYAAYDGHDHTAIQELYRHDATPRRDLPVQDEAGSRRHRDRNAEAIRLGFRTSIGR